MACRASMVASISCTRWMTDSNKARESDARSASSCRAWTVDELRYLFQELRPGRLVLEDHVIPAPEWHEPRARNARGDRTGFGERDEVIEFGMQHQGRRANARRILGDVHVRENVKVTERVCGTRRGALQFVEPLELLVGPLWKKKRGEYPAERVASFPPPDFQELRENGCPLDSLRFVVRKGAAQQSSIQDQ